MKPVRMPIKPHQNAKELDEGIIPFSADLPIRSWKQYHKYYPEHDKYDFIRWCMRQSDFQLEKYEVFWRRNVIKAFKASKPPVEKPTICTD